MGCFYLGQSSDNVLFILQLITYPKILKNIIYVNNILIILAYDIIISSSVAKTAIGLEIPQCNDNVTVNVTVWLREMQHLPS